MILMIVIIFKNFSKNCLIFETNKFIKEANLITIMPIIINIFSIEDYDINSLYHNIFFKILLTLIIIIILNLKLNCLKILLLIQQLEIKHMID